jgi:hypothetical protein
LSKAGLSLIEGVCGRRRFRLSSGKPRASRARLTSHPALEGRPRGRGDRRSAGSRWSLSWSPCGSKRSRVGSTTATFCRRLQAPRLTLDATTSAIDVRVGRAAT